jgi:Uma2 family endonuclease
VSDSSTRKDAVTLKAAYFRAGVLEYWLIDARGETLSFEIFTRGADGYVAATRSEVFDRSFRLERTKNRAGRWDYRLIAD